MTEQDIRRIVLDTLDDVLRNALQAFEISPHGLTPHQALSVGVVAARAQTDGCASREAE